MNKTNIFKASLIATAIITIFSSTNDKVFANMECTEVKNDNVKYVNASLVDINPEEYNSYVRGISKSEYYSKNLQERAECDNNSVLFGLTQNMVVGGLQNEHTGPGAGRKTDGVIQGIVKNKLVNGNLAVADKFNNGQSLFPQSGNIGSDKPYNKILNNWKFPFLKKQNGYYDFNSEEYHVSADYLNKSFKLHKGGRNGFFPFNNCQDDTFEEKNRNLYFTVKLEIPFVMTGDGRIKNTETGNWDDMVFNFSGDDDVWAFVDDDLVLDLGGTHSKQTGNIDFATNKVWYNCVSNTNLTSDSYNVTKNAISTGKLTQGKHTLRVFYMERAGGVSNLFTSFNLQSSGLEINHIDKSTGDILKKEYKSGQIGETIETGIRTFKGYEFLESEAPKNPNVVLNEDIQVLNYYYIKTSDVTAEYIDIADNQNIAENVKTKYREGKTYNTNSKNINNYTLTKIEGEPNGKVARNDINIKYYYRYNSNIGINYIDKTNGNSLSNELKSGLEGDKIKLEDKQFENYILVKKPEEIEATYLKKEQNFNYYYLHQNNINVNYIDKATGKNLDKISEKEVEGTLYQTKAKEFDNYKLVERPEAENYLIARDDVEVNYYYEKLKFNLKIDMNLEKTIINDNYYGLKNKVDKVETQIKEANGESNAKIYYRIKVSNDQERKGSGKITDTIPENYIALSEDNQGWSINENLATFEVNDIQPNESREYILVLTKKQGIDICQTITNKVKIDSLGIEETNLNDNEDKNDLVIMPRTGKKQIFYSIISLALITLLFIIRYKKSKMKKAFAKIMVLKEKTKIKRQ